MWGGGWGLLRFGFCSADQLRIARELGASSITVSPIVFAVAVPIIVLLQTLLVSPLVSLRWL